MRTSPTVRVEPRARAVMGSDSCASTCGPRAPRSVDCPASGSRLGARVLRTPSTGGPTCVRAGACTKNSTLPSAPRSGDTATAPTPSPCASSPATTSRSTAACTDGIAHDPALADAGPGPPRTAASPAARSRRRRSVSASRFGATVRSEMNERSATHEVGGRIDRTAVSSSRTLVRSMTVTRASLRSDQASCPRPTSIATTCAAPRWSRQSVKPPVDAPTSTARRPATSTPNASSAPASLRPPRETNVGRRRLRRDDDRLGPVDLAGGGGRRRAAHGDAARDDHVDGPGATGRESTPDELDVEASAHGSPLRRALRWPGVPCGRLRTLAGRRLLRGTPSSRAISWPAPSSRAAFFAGAVFGAFLTADFVAVDALPQAPLQRGEVVLGGEAEPAELALHLGRSRPCAAPRCGGG